MENEIYDMYNYKPIELYAEINGYPNYMVSTLARVKNLQTNKILKPQMNSGGYLRVRLCNNGKVKNKRIHRLVADHFIPKFNTEYILVDHIDRNKTNNCVNNLRWCSSSINNINTKMHKTNTSGFSGVSFDKSNNRFRAYWYENKKLCTKSFSCNKYSNALKLSIEFRAKMIKTIDAYIEALKFCK